MATGAKVRNLGEAETTVKVLGYEVCTMAKILPNPDGIIVGMDVIQAAGISYIASSRIVQSSLESQPIQTELSTNPGSSINAITYMTADELDGMLGDESTPREIEEIVQDVQGDKEIWRSLL